MGCDRVDGRPPHVHALRPCQLGFGGKNACESMGISLQALVDNCPLGNSWVLASVDITNAFNSVKRQAVLEGVARLVPHLLPWASLSLGAPSPLFCGLHEIQSRCGVHQGGLLVGLLFCLGIHSAVEAVQQSIDGMSRGTSTTARSWGPRRQSTLSLLGCYRHCDGWGVPST